MKTIVLSLLWAVFTFQGLAQNTIQVTNLNDSGPGSLRQAVADAGENEVIDLRGLVGTIYFKSSIYFKNSVYIIADGYDKLILDGSENFENTGEPDFFGALIDSPPSSLTFEGVSFKNSIHRKGFEFTSGNLDQMTFKKCFFENNQNEFGLIHFDEAIAIEDLKFESCTFLNNKIIVSTGADGTINHLYISSSTFLRNETVFNNLSRRAVGEYRINNSTIVDCTTLLKRGENIFFNLSSNILIVNNYFIELDTSPVLFGSNNIGTNADSLGIGLDISPQLENELTVGLGPTPVLLPLERSPVVDAGINPFELTEDQTGRQRVNGNGIDIGSVETDYFQTPPQIDLGSDITVCNVDSVLLDAGSDYPQYVWSNGATGQLLKVTGSGEYSVFGTTEFGISSSDTIKVIFDPELKPEISTEFNVCNGSINLSVTNYKSYLWSTNSTTQKISITQTGEYIVEVIDNLGCQGSDKISVEIDSDPSCKPPAINPLAVTAACSNYPNLLRRWKITNPNTTSLRLDWEIVDTMQKSWIDIPAGDSYLTTIAFPFHSNTLKIYWHNEKGEKKFLQQSSVTTRCQKPLTSSRAATETETVLSEGAVLKTYPNPGKDQITIEVLSNEEADASLQIISSAGVIQDQRSIRLDKGSNFIVQDVSKLAQGTYLIKTSDQSIRFIKE